MEHLLEQGLQALGAIIPVAAALAIAWLRAQAKRVAKDAAIEAELHGREMAMDGLGKKAFAMMVAKGRMPKGVFGALAPGASAMSKMIEKSVPKAKAEADRVGR